MDAKNRYGMPKTVMGCQKPSWNARNRHGMPKTAFGCQKPKNFNLLYQVYPVVRRRPGLAENKEF